MKHRKEIVELSVNGETYELAVQPQQTLLEVLRGILGLTGTKEGCSLGECGACTVIIDGQTVNSCLVLAAEADGKSIITIEGLTDGDKLHPIQQAFIDCSASQCGYCTPGMIMAAKALLDDNPSPTRDQIVHSISGNICRCTGYYQIVDAIELAAKRIREGAE